MNQFKSEEGDPSPLELAFVVWQGFHPVGTTSPGFGPTFLASEWCKPKAQWTAGVSPVCARVWGRSVLLVHTQ